MKRSFYIGWLMAVFMALLMCHSLPVSSSVQQTKKTSVRKTSTRKKTTRKTTVKGNKKKSSTKASSRKSRQVRKKRTSTTTRPVTVKSLQNERQQVQRRIKEQERRLRSNEQNVKKRLQTLLVINNEIEDKRKSIDTIRREISSLDENILLLGDQLKTLKKELEERKYRFLKSMRYMHRNRNIQNQFMFVFSAQNFSQMYRRLRFVREYASYQQAQGEAVKSMQAQVKEAYNELNSSKRKKKDLLYRDELERKSLEDKQTEQQKVVKTLQRQQKTIQSIIEKQKKRDAELNVQIDKMIAEEIARAKAEAKRKAEAERRAKELARKRAAAEAAAKENARRVAEAKAKEERAKAEVRAAARKSAAEKAAAERAARLAEQERMAAERKAANDAKAHEKAIAEVRRSKADTGYRTSPDDLKLSGNFENNKGRLPMPITGSYKIVNRFGTNTVTDVKGHVTLDKKGIDIKGQPGAAVRCIFDGEVSAVFGYAGTTVVIVRHGSYLSVYCDLASVSVRRGQKVSARQTLGRVGSEGMMQFQLRRGNAKLNPESWLRR